MSSSHRVPRRTFIAAVSLTTLAPMAIAIGQSSVAVSPFVSYVPSAATNPLAGMALTFGGTTGLALRAGADMSIANPDKTASTTDGTTGASTGTIGGYRPWSADADAMLFLGGLGGGATVFSRSLSPYVFSGIGLSGGDSAGVNVVHNGWSYGAGASIPLGFDADVFGEARWRMSEYVLPTSKSAPSSKSEFRFGLSFHVGGGSRDPGPAPSPRRGGGRRRMDSYEDVVVAPQPAPATATATAIVNVPESVVADPDESRRYPDETRTYPTDRRTYPTDRRTYPADRRTYPAETRTRANTSVTTTRVQTTRSSRGIVYRTRQPSAKATVPAPSARPASPSSTRTQTTTSTSCGSGRGAIGARRSAAACTTARRVEARRSR